MNNQISSTQCGRVANTSGGMYVEAFVALGQGEVVPQEAQDGGGGEIA
jgi:hypothetical protein